MKAVFEIPVEEVPLFIERTEFYGTTISIEYRKAP